MPATASIPQDATTKLTNTALQNCQQEVPALVASTRNTPDSLILRTSPAKVRLLALYIRNTTHLQFKTLADIAVVDRLLPAGRFVVNYAFLSVVNNQRLTVQLSAAETTTIPSLAGNFANKGALFSSAS